MKTVKMFCLVSLSAMIVTACVPQRKYQDAENARAAAIKRSNECNADKQRLNEQIADLKKSLAGREKELADLQKDTANVYPIFRKIKSANSDLNLLYEKAIAQSNALAQSAAGEKRELAAELDKKQRELERREKELQDAQRTLADAQRTLENAKKDLDASKKAFEEKSKQAGQLEGDLSQAQKDLKAREQRVQELESLIAAQKEKTEELRKKIAGALSGFNANELSVTQRDGKVYVSLSQELLFASGSAEVDKKGRDALTRLAVELNKVTDIDIVVEGHTDNVPYKGSGGVKDNWDLSVVRSTSIVRILTGAGVDAKRITAAGRGEYIPVAENTSAAGKAKNRRTEIILAPKLDQLYDLIDK